MRTKKVPNTERGHQRIELILANVPTVREILNIIEPSPEWLQFWEDFIKDLMVHAKRKVHEFTSWRSELNDTDLWFWRDGWGGGKNDPVCIGVSFLELMKGKMGNPRVYLFIPAGGKKRNTFIEDIDVISRRKLGRQWEKGEDEYVRYSYVEMEKCGNGKQFNSVSLMNDVTRKLSELIRLAPEIDRVLKKS